MANFNWPSITTTAGPAQFVLDGSNQAVTKDTATPVNSNPLPVEVLDAGVKVDFATSAKQDAQSALLGSITEAAPASDTASSGLNGRLQRVAQRLSSLIALLPVSLGQKTASGSFGVVLASDQTLPLPTGAATEATLASIDSKDFATQTTLAAINSKDFATSAKQDDQSTLLGAVTETAPASDTASSGLNGRLQRIAQRITSLIALLPTSLGQKTSANSLAVTLASDQSAVPASQSGTWTVNSATSSTSNVTSVSASASSVSLLASNASRKNATFYNDSSAVLFIKLGSTASTTSYTVQVSAGGYYELPTGNIYSGSIDGIWSSATGSCRITELS